ncbi:MAG: hypothetical protein HYZ20_14775 [Burkholderiales bacterium]|nr:hypothetical protein [Burkholderiales bacterium]
MRLRLRLRLRVRLRLRLRLRVRLGPCLRSTLPQMRFALAALLLLGCRRELPVRADPVDARPPAPVVPAKASRVLRAGRVIDRREARVVAVVSEKTPRLEASDDRHGYFVDGAGLHAVDLASAKELWSKKIDPPRDLAVSDDGAVLVHEKVVTLHGRDSAHAFTFGAAAEHLVARGHVAFVVVGGTGLQRLDLPARKASVVATLPFPVMGWRSALRFSPDGRTVCAYASAATLEIACFGEHPVRSTIDLRAPGDPKGVSFAIRASDERFVVFGTGPFFHSGVRRGAIVRLSDGAVVTRVEDELAAAVVRDDGSLEGALVATPELRMYEPSGALRFKVPSPAPHDESASAIARGGRLYLDVYPSISSGSALVALDAKTGATAWRADVEMLPIGHSEYFNEVRLSFDGDRLSLSGEESSLTTFQMFALADGTRALAVSALHP